MIVESLFSRCFHEQRRFQKLEDDELFSELTNPQAAGNSGYVLFVQFFESIVTSKKWLESHTELVQRLYRQLSDLRRLGQLEAGLVERVCGAMISQYGHLSSLRASESFYDTAFTVEGQKVGASRLLMSQNPILERLIKEGETLLSDVTVSQFLVIRDFLEKRALPSVDRWSPRELEAFLGVCNKYELRRLLDALERALMGAMDPTLQAYELSKKYGLDQLAEHLLGEVRIDRYNVQQAFDQSLNRRDKQLEQVCIQALIHEGMSDTYSAIQRITDPFLSTWSPNELATIVVELKHCHNLNLRGAIITDEVVEALPESIYALNLSETEVTDAQLNRLTSRLSHLEKIDLSGCHQLTSLTPLGNCPQLVALKMNHLEAVEDLGFLSKLHLLQKLHVDGCPNLSQFHVIGELGRLKKLSIRSSKGLESVEFLSGCPFLTDLDVGRCPSLKSLEGLVCGDRLKALLIDQCSAIRDFDVLEQLKALEELNISECSYLPSLDGLKGMHQLKALSAALLPNVSSAEPLAHLERLKRLDLSCSAIKSLDPLESLSDLEELILEGLSHLKSLDPLSRHVRLKVLRLAQCRRLSSIVPLRYLINLIELDLSYCPEIQVIDVVGGLRSLERLNLSHCHRILDASALKGCQKLVFLDVSGCKGMTDLTPVEHVKVVHDASS